MTKNLFFILFLSVTSFSFAQNSIGKYEIKGFQFEVQTDFVTNSMDNSQKEVYRILRIENDSIVQSVEIDKNVKSQQGEITTVFQMMDDVFVFEKTQTFNQVKKYAVDRVFVGNNGKLYKHDEKYFDPIKSDLNTYDAQFPGGRKGLENWVRKHFDSNHFERFANEGEPQVVFQINFTVDENGKISEIEVLGNGGWKEKALEIMNRMPDWFPAVEKGVKIKAKMKLPIHIVLDY